MPSIMVRSFAFLSAKPATLAAAKSINATADAADLTGAGALTADGDVMLATRATGGGVGVTWF